MSSGSGSRRSNESASSIRKRSINNSTTTTTPPTPTAPQTVTATSSTHRHQHHQHSSEDGSESDYSEDEDEDEDGSASEDDEGEGDEGDGATAAGRPRTGSNAQSTSRKASRSGSNKKSRISQACDSCRRRKRKCDGAQPVCSACQKLHLPCLYQTMVKKRGPQPGVVKRLRQEVKQLETEIQREQRQAKLAKFSTLTSGVVPEANVSHNPTMPVGDGSHLGGPATEHEQEDAFATVSLNAAANSRVRNETYLNTYFTLLNNTMFPLLDEKAFYDELKRYEADPSIEVPMSWNLRYAAALSVGSMIYGDVEYAQSAGHVARHAASQLFDQPDPDVLRGMLVLAFHCLSTNQQSRSACYLAVATRMCCLVDISPEIPPLATFMEDMLCSINWWYSGFDVLPIGGYKQIQSDLYPNDKAEYEHLIESQRVRIKDVEEHQLGNTQVNTTMRSMNSRSPTINSTTTSAIPPVSSNASEPSSNHTSSQSADSSSDSSNTPVTAPVTPAVDEDATLRWELLKVMCFTSGMRGEMNKPPSFSLYRCLYILTKSLISPLTVGAIRTLILYFKVVCLKMLATTDEDLRELVHNATLATEAAQTHDTTHCPFYSLCFHVIAQVHMMHRYGSDEEVEELIVKDLDIVDKVSRKWEFGMPMLQNLHARILSAYGPGGRTAHHPALLALIANSREHFNHATVNGQITTDELDVLSPPDRARASLIFSATQVSNKPAPSIVDTMNNLHEKFGSTLKLTEDELIDMAQIKKGLINGPMPVSNSQGSSSGSERSGLTPDMNVGHKGLAETPEMTTPVPLPQFDSIAYAAATGESPPAMNMVHFDRPDLDELMQFGLIDDAPTPSEVFLPIAKSQHDFNYPQAPSAPAHQQYSGMNNTPVMKPPMYTPSPNTYNPSYPQMQSMSPPIPSYQSTAPTYPTYNSSNLAAKERELRQQLDALIQQQQYQQQQQQQYHQHQQQQLHNHHQQQFSHQTQSMYSPPIQSPPSNGYPIQYPQSSPSHPSLSHLPTSSPSSLPYSHGSYDTMRSYETYSSSGLTSGNLPHPMRSNSNTVPSPQSYAPSQYNNNYGPITYAPSTQATANEEYFNQQFPPTPSPSQHQPLNTTNIPF